MAIKTSKRNQIFTVQKKIRGQWCIIQGAYFPKRSQARECSRDLNNIAKVTGRGPNRRYRVAAMRVVADSGQ